MVVKNDLDVLQFAQFEPHLNMEKWFLECHLYVCIFDLI
jgi:hypothetical protein